MYKKKAKLVIPDFIGATQHNIIINKENNENLFSKENYESLVSLINEISKTIFEEEYKSIIYKESNKITINLLGKFAPYKNTDRIKYHDVMVSYDSYADWVKIESDNIVYGKLEHINNIRIETRRLS